MNIAHQRGALTTAFLALLVVSSAPAFGQAPTGHAAVDSANVARTAWRAANVAARASDWNTALREARRAATAWPTQEAYAWGHAVVAALAGDTAAFVHALERYAGTGFGRDARADARFAPFIAGSAARAALDRIDANRAPLVRSRVAATLPDSAFYPEGMDVDPRTRRMYVASIRHRTVAELSPDGTVIRDVFPRGTPGIGAVLGVRVDTARNALWITTAGLAQMDGYAPRDSAIAAVIRLSLRDGTIERRWDLPASPLGHTLGDLAVSAAGDVYATDSREPVLYRIRPGADTLERITHPIFRSLQGIAPTRDGRAVYVADWTHGLLRVELATGAVTRLADAPGSSSLGIDGIALQGASIIAVQNGSVPRRVMRFTLDGGGTRIVRADVLDRNTTVADEPTIGALVGNEFFYVANSQWDKYGDDGARIAGTTISRAVILVVPVGLPSPTPTHERPHVREL